MQVALIGGTGFVGSYLIEALLTHHHKPAVLVRQGSEARLNRADECRVVSGDLDDDEALLDLLKGCDAAIYNVGILRESAGITFEGIQHESACRVIRHAEFAGVGRFLLMSANGVSENGVPYQRSKWQAERCALDSGMDATVFRPSVIFGDPSGRMEIATQLLVDMVRPPIPAVNFLSVFGAGKGPVWMSPVYVRDVADAFVAALENSATVGHTYELGGPETLTWGEMIRRVAKACSKRKILLPMPIEFMRLAAVLLDWAPAFPVTRDQLTMLAEGNIASSEELARLIGRSPRAFTVESLSYLNSR